MTAPLTVEALTDLIVEHTPGDRGLAERIALAVWPAVQGERVRTLWATAAEWEDAARANSPRPEDHTLDAVMTVRRAARWLRSDAARIEESSP